MLQHNIWEELVRIREVMALDSYTRQMARLYDEMEETDLGKLSAKRLSDHIERRMDVAEELDKCRVKMMAIAFPMEHL
jgi:hypothetical protein